MIREKGGLLIVEDSPSLRRIYTEYLKRVEIEVDSVGTVQSARELINQKLYRAVLLDLRLPDGNGFELMEEMINTGVGTPVIIMTAHGSIDMAVEAMRVGAYDFLEKPFDAKRLKAVLGSALAQKRQIAIGSLDQPEEIRAQFHGFVGSSDTMQSVYHLIERAAPSKASVFITGESGTGKELCAEALHRQSARAQGPFIAINCAAIPKDLMESEIFGHVKGAFTGATSSREGAASMANGGTLFLDEIGEMSLDLQSKLLRFIQTGTIQKVGGSSEEQVDVRFICATNRDPLEAVSEGRFREDLYYRLYVIPVELPPLRERGLDPLLIGHQFLRKYARDEGKYFEGFSPEVEAILTQYHWPGNVRQLQNIIHNIVVLNKGGLVERVHLPPPLNRFECQVPVAQQVVVQPTHQPAPNSVVLAEAEPLPTESPAAPAPTGPILLARSADEVRPLAELERIIIENAINLAEGNVPKAAALLDVSPSTLYRKRQAWDEADSAIGRTA